MEYYSFASLKTANKLGLNFSHLFNFRPTSNDSNLKSRHFLVYIFNINTSTVLNTFTKVEK